MGLVQYGKREEEGLKTDSKKAKSEVMLSTLLYLHTSLWLLEFRILQKKETKSNDFCLKKIFLPSVQFDYMAVSFSSFLDGF